MTDSVVSVTPAGDTDVWDIEIRGESPVFGAGGILVHNCFLSTGNPRFNDEGVTRLELMAKHGHDKALRGVLESNGLHVNFLPRDDDPWVWVREKPVPMCCYIAFLDPCYASQSKGAKYPDAHAAGILRDAYMDAAGAFHPKELVACIDVPNGCRWDASLIAERLVMLANFYGGCMVVPETGNGDAVLLKLQEFGANVYVRPKFDSQIPGKTLSVLGWETNSSTRNIWVEAMADAIREQEKSFDCCYQPAVKEMRTFIVDDRQKACAAQGKHDDWVTGIGIGLACIQFSGVYYPPLWREKQQQVQQKNLAFS